MESGNGHSVWPGNGGLARIPGRPGKGAGKYGNGQEVAEYSFGDQHFWGGLRASMELSRICETFGRGLSMHSNSHLGISLAAMVHLGADLPQLPYALDTHYPWQSDEVITGGRFQFEEGAVAVPLEPGLGVELDRGALARLHQNYLDCGLT